MSSSSSLDIMSLNHKNVNQLYEPHDRRKITSIDSLKKKKGDLIRVNFEYHVNETVVMGCTNYDFNLGPYTLRVPDYAKFDGSNDLFGILQRNQKGNIIFTPNQVLGELVFTRNVHKAIIPFLGRFSPSFTYTYQKAHSPARFDLELRPGTDLIEFYRSSKLEKRLGSVSVEEIK